MIVIDNYDNSRKHKYPDLYSNAAQTTTIFKTV